MAVSLDMFMQGMERLDIRDFRRKKSGMDLNIISQTGKMELIFL
jgi:hypothetical protein